MASIHDHPGAGAQYNVYVRGTELDRLYDVAQQLSTAGMHVEQVAENLGVVSGSIPAEVVPRIERMSSVEYVVPDRDVATPEDAAAAGWGLP